MSEAPAAFLSSVMLASSSWTLLMFLSLSSATNDTCTDTQHFNKSGLTLKQQSMNAPLGLIYYNFYADTTE